jgi:SAM-dependent methyltransferase
MSSVWDERAEAYRDSPGHREGPDLDLVVRLCEPAPGVEALDVATGGGHVARRLREAGCRVTTCDASPGMRPDVVCRAENLPFVGASFDVVACRIAPHHFEDVSRAVLEMARVSRMLVVVEDTLYEGEAMEAAAHLRDPSHVRHYTDGEWRQLFEGAGLELEAIEFFEKRRPVGAWLALTGCAGGTALRVRELLRHRIDGEDMISDRHIVLKGRKQAA